MNADTLQRLRGATDLRIAVVGDLMLDEYLSGTSNRISPEAPVPVVDIEACDVRCGGAANVAANLAALGVQVALFGICGRDSAGEQLAGLIGESGIDPAGVVRSGTAQTITKTRVSASGWQLLRLDRESRHATPPDSLAELERSVFRYLEEVRPDALILSDYAKGTLTCTNGHQFIDAARRFGVPVFVDPKGSDVSKYRGATLLSPNLTEMAHWVSVYGHDNRMSFTQWCLEQFDLSKIVCTLGPDGMDATDRSGTISAPAQANEVFDVSGAGDTVIAILAICHALGVSDADSLLMANTAAGVVVRRRGTAVVSLEELLGEFLTHPIALSVPALQSQIADWRAGADRIVFTNGCFDLVHIGHIHLLQEAAKLGDRLIVAINSDDSISRLKGPTRPFVTAEHRAAILGAMDVVDAVIVFETATPLGLIKRLKPDVLVKGGDYDVESIVGSKEVAEWGGDVTTIPFLQGHSTTRLGQRIKQAI